MGQNSKTKWKKSNSWGASALLPAVEHKTTFATALAATRCSSKMVVALTRIDPSFDGDNAACRQHSRSNHMECTTVHTVQPVRCIADKESTGGDSVPPVAAAISSFRPYLWMAQYPKPTVRVQDQASPYCPTPQSLSSVTDWVATSI